MRVSWVLELWFLKSFSSNCFDQFQLLFQNQSTIVIMNVSLIYQMLIDCYIWWDSL